VGQPASLGCLLVKVDDILHVLLGTQEDRQPLVDARWLDVQDPLGTGRGETTGLFCEVRHGEGFVEDSQLAVRALLVAWVTKDTSVEQRSVNIGNHGTNVSCAVWLAVCGVLDAVEVLLCWLVEVERVSLVEGVDLSSVGNSDIRVGEDEFSEGLEGASVSICGKHSLRLTSSRVKPLTPWPVERTKLQLLPYMV
jgi:hypothetical protein